MKTALAKSQRDPTKPFSSPEWYKALKLAQDKRVKEIPVQIEGQNYLLVRTEGGYFNLCFPDGKKVPLSSSILNSVAGDSNWSPTVSTYVHRADDFIFFVPGEVQLGSINENTLGDLSYAMETYPASKLSFTYNGHTIYLEFDGSSWKFFDKNNQPISNNLPKFTPLPKNSSSHPLGISSQTFEQMTHTLPLQQEASASAITQGGGPVSQEGGATANLIKASRNGAQLAQAADASDMSSQALRDTLDELSQTRPQVKTTIKEIQNAAERLQNEALNRGRWSPYQSKIIAETAWELVDGRENVKFLRTLSDPEQVKNYIRQVTNRHLGTYSNVLVEVREEYVPVLTQTDSTLILDAALNPNHKMSPLIPGADKVKVANRSFFSIKQIWVNSRMQRVIVDAQFPESGTEAPPTMVEPFSQPQVSQLAPQTLAEKVIVPMSAEGMRAHALNEFKFVKTGDIYILYLEDAPVPAVAEAAQAHWLELFRKSGINVTVQNGHYVTDAAGVAEFVKSLNEGGGYNRPYPELTVNVQNKGTSIPRQQIEKRVPVTNTSESTVTETSQLISRAPFTAGSVNINPVTPKGIEAVEETTKFVSNADKNFGSLLNTAAELAETTPEGLQIAPRPVAKTLRVASNLWQEAGAEAQSLAAKHPTAATVGSEALKWGGIALTGAGLGYNIDQQFSESRIEALNRANKTERNTDLTRANDSREAKRTVESGFAFGSNWLGPEVGIPVTAAMMKLSSLDSDPDYAAVNEAWATNAVGVGSGWVKAIDKKEVISQLVGAATPSIRKYMDAEPRHGSRPRANLEQSLYIALEEKHLPPCFIPNLLGTEAKLQEMMRELPNWNIILSNMPDRAEAEAAFAQLIGAPSQQAGLFQAGSNEKLASPPTIDHVLVDKYLDMFVDRYQVLEGATLNKVPDQRAMQRIAQVENVARSYADKAYNEATGALKTIYDKYGSRLNEVMELRAQKLKATADALAEIEASRRAYPHAQRSYDKEKRNWENSLADQVKEFDSYYNDLNAWYIGSRDKILATLQEDFVKAPTTDFRNDPRIWIPDVRVYFNDRPLPQPPQETLLAEAPLRRPTFADK